MFVPPKIKPTLIKKPLPIFLPPPKLSAGTDLPSVFGFACHDVLNKWNNIVCVP